MALYNRLTTEVFDIFTQNRLFIDLQRECIDIDFQLNYILEKILLENMSSKLIVDNVHSCLKQLELISTKNNVGQRLYEKLNDIFIYSVDPLVKSLFEGNINAIFGTGDLNNTSFWSDYCSEYLPAIFTLENLKMIHENEHSLAFLCALDANHPLINFKRPFSSIGTANNLFSKK